MSFRFMFLLALAGLTQTQAMFGQQPARARFAVAIPDSGASQSLHYDPLSDSGEYFTYLDCSKFPHARGWDSAHPGAKRPSTIELGFAVAGDNLVIMATAYYGDRLDGSVPKRIIGGYRAGENDKFVTLSGMSAIGLAPIKIGIQVLRQPSDFTYSDVPFCTTPAGATYVCGAPRSRKANEQPSGTAAVTGRILDAAGHPLDGVMLLLTSVAEKGSAAFRTYDTITSDDGAYTVVNIRPGSYTVKAVKAGYVSASESALRLEAGHSTRNSDLVLSPLTSMR